MINNSNGQGCFEQKERTANQEYESECEENDFESGGLECVLVRIGNMDDKISDMIQRIVALEVWIWRRMEKVSETERKTNEVVPTMVGEKRQLIERIIKTKKRWMVSMFYEEMVVKGDQRKNKWTGPQKK